MDVLKAQEVTFLNFDADRASLNHRNLDLLNELALGHAPNELLIIYSIWIDSANMLASRKLAMRRAETTRDYLLAIGIPSDLLEISEKPEYQFDYSLPMLNDEANLKIMKIKKPAL